MPIETRSADASFQTREESELFTISGYFAVFRSPYAICPGCNEFVDAHAFDDTLKDDIRALINHETALVLGRTAANTLRLRTDSHGLYGEIDVNRNDTDAMNLYHRVKRGDVNQCSFGFEILEERHEWKDNGDLDVILTKIRLYEVSVVTFPAYQETAVNARSALSGTRQAKIAALRRQRINEQKTALRNILRNAKQ